MIQCIIDKTIRLEKVTNNTFLTAPLVSGNSLAHMVRLRVLDSDGEPADLTGISATGAFNRPDGHQVTPINVTITGNVVECVFPASCYTTAGRFRFMLDLNETVNNETALRTAFVLDGLIEIGPTGSVVDPGTPVPNIQAAIANAQLATTAANTAAQTATTAAAAAQDVADNVEGEVSALKSAVADGDPLNVLVDVGTLIDGEYIKSNDGAIYQNGAYKRTDYISIDPHTVISVKLTGGGSSINALAFYDENKLFVQGIISPTLRDSITVPSTAKYCIYSGTNEYIGEVSLYYITNTVISALQESVEALEHTSAAITTFGDIKILDYTIPLKNVSGVNAMSGNLVAISECVNNSYINFSGGGVVSNQPNYFATGYIPVVAGKTYKANVGRNFAWYNANKQYISGSSGQAIINGISAPENAAYIRFTVNKTSDGIQNPLGLYFADVDDYSDDVVIPHLLVDNTKPWCYGKKINWIGDSIVDGQDFDEYVASALGLTETDYGINGSTIALKADGTDGRNALCARYTSMSNDADIIAVSCGTNDFEYAWCQIGTIEDADDGTSNTTFYGALKALCKGLITKYPKKLIFFTTPIKRGQPFADGAGGEYTQDGVTLTPFSKNKYGKTLGDYADIIKEVCGLYSIPVLDMYRESLLNPHLTAQQDMFDNVLTHPNADGQKIMARRVAGWMTQLGYNVT